VKRISKASEHQVTAHYIAAETSTSFDDVHIVEK
jgi:hypothetical protein